MSGQRLRRRNLTAALVVLSLVMSGCTSKSPSTITLSGVTMTQAEFFYGRNVLPDPSVVYEPDVVVIANGADAVRKASAGGILWTLDARARGVDQLEVDKVMFLTSQAVGRVLAMEHEGDDVTIALGPVDVTEVFHEATFEWVDVPVDPDEALYQGTGDLPWSVTDPGPLGGEEPDDAHARDDPAGTLHPGDLPPGVPEGPDDGSGADDPAESVDPERSLPEETEGALGSAPSIRRPVRTEAQTTPTLPDDLTEEEFEQISGILSPDDIKKTEMPKPATNAPIASSLAGFDLRPYYNSGGVGVWFQYKSGLELTARLQLHGSLRTSGRFEIGGGELIRGHFYLHGAGGVSYRFVGSSHHGLSDNIRERIEVPGRIVIPLPGPTGLSLSVTQRVLVSTGFSAKNSRMQAEGSFTFSGRFGFTFANGQFRALPPQNRRLERSLLDTIRGVSPGANGLVLGHQVEARVGLGPDIFSVGPYVGLTTSLGVVRGSDFGSPLVVCRGASLNQEIRVGVSYRIPEIVAVIVNLFLSFVGAKKVISHEGDLVSRSMPVISRSAQLPDLKVCKW